MLANVVGWIVAVLAAVRLHQTRRNTLLRPLAPLETPPPAPSAALAEDTVSYPPSAYFGERPHYFIPPSDMEPYRKRSHRMREPFVSGVLGDPTLHIPYPDDPPHTFPAIKARKLFTKHPKKIVTLAASKGAAIPLKAMEDRFRTVYGSAEVDGLGIVIGNRARPDQGIGGARETYDFQSRALLSPAIG